MDPIALMQFTNFMRLRIALLSRPCIALAPYPCIVCGTLRLYRLGSATCNDTNFAAIFQCIGHRLTTQHIVHSGGLQAVLDCYAELGEDFEGAVKSMLVFDAVIYNKEAPKSVHRGLIAFRG